MIKHLRLKNVGPAPEMELEFGSRLNLFTGDNGLGKSFLLDIAWWAMTRKWPAEVNPRLTSGKVARPTDIRQESEIGFSFSAVSRDLEYSSIYDPQSESWASKRGRPANPGLVFYALADGSFAVWDPARNYWKSKDEEGPERPAAYVFSPRDVWDGLQRKDGAWLCNGLIRDWAGWQKERGRPFDLLCVVLEVLSPSKDELLRPGKLARISLDDVRDMPTLTMPYGMDVAVVHASSGMRRIISLAYFLVWCWEEHLQAIELQGGTPENKTVFLVDEVESHLHPKWQRTVIPALMSVMDKLSDSAEVQLIAATHSPLIMASVEPFFDAASDAWFDLDLEDREVKLRRREFEKYGEAGNWLTSEAFDLPSGRAIVFEKLLEEASQILVDNNTLPAKAEAIYQELLKALGPKDDYLFRWRFLASKRNLLP